MVSMLNKRFKEMAKRKLHGVKARWFEPLNKVELEKLGIDDKRNVKEISL